MREEDICTAGVKMKFFDLCLTGNGEGKPLCKN